MRPEVRILGGLALITAGAAGLIAMNLWTVPTIGQGRARPEAIPTPPPRSPVTVPTTTRSATPPASVVPTVASSGAMPDAGPVDAAVEAALDVAIEPTGGVTSRSEDGTSFAPIVFEPQSKALSKGLIEKIGPIAAYMRNNYAMMVTLTGHGDAGMSTAEYIRIGRFRAGAVLRTLVDYGVSGARIGIALPKVEGDKIVAGDVPPGTVEVYIKSRFAKPEKGEDDGT